MRMLWFNHPKPVGRRKEVAVLVQRQSIDPVALTLDAPAGEAASLLAPDDPVAISPLQFSVRYALPEYVSFMWQHAGYLIRRRRVGRAAGWYLLARSTSAAALRFVVQGRSRRIYDFTIDEHGILRSSTAGVTVLGWGDVKNVRRYTRGYMLVLKQGTLPIPYRCLGAGQAAQFDGYAATIRAAALR